MTLVFNPANLSVSIVSHGHGHLLKDLLLDLQPIMQDGTQVLLTLNTPEDEDFLNNLVFQPELIRNSYPKGFGENHNNAFSRVRKSWFVVINPDVRLTTQTFSSLIAEYQNSYFGVIAPRVMNTSGDIEDTARYYPTIPSILFRIINRILGFRSSFDYDLSKSQLLSVDWISGCFMLFKSDVFKLIGGFDTRFYMYLEDTDICRRLRIIGYDVCICTKVSIIHEAQYASRSQWRHICWHFRSLICFLRTKYHH
jgi:hypothetical protein